MFVCFLFIRILYRPFLECPEYLQEEGQNVGCRTPIVAGMRFQSFYTKLSVGGNQSICKNYTDLRPLGNETSSEGGFFFLEGDFVCFLFLNKQFCGLYIYHFVSRFVLFELCDFEFSCVLIETFVTNVKLNVMTV